MANVSLNVPPCEAVTTIMPASGGASSSDLHSSAVKAALVVMAMSLRIDSGPAFPRRGRGSSSAAKGATEGARTANAGVEILRRAPAWQQPRGASAEGAHRRHMVRAAGGRVHGRAPGRGGSVLQLHAGAEVDAARHPGAVVRAVAPRHLVQVLLVVVLGVVERARLGRRAPLGGDVAVAVRGQVLLVRRPGGL